MNDYNFYVGIDLGTTNSAISLAEKPRNYLNTPILNVSRFTGKSCRSRQEEKTLPSAVLYKESKTGTYETFVGDCAVEMSTYRPFAVARNVKEQMGQPKLTYPNWCSDYPDQTPQAVSARILNHLLDAVQDSYGERPTEAVITVPASYSTIKRQATLEAAELANLNVKNADGSYRDDVLLSEPEAVLFHLLNEHQNGHLALPCDFTTPKNVMIYDMGGGTLDVTLHQVIQSENSDNYDMRLIATNRFCNVAGNMMDQKLTDFMYDKYIRDLAAEQPETVKIAQAHTQEDKIFFNRMAEQVKIQFSNRIRNYRKRGSELSAQASEPYGDMLSSSMTVDSTITRAEVESCLSPCMGLLYQYSDYKRFDQLPPEQNILYPVLQVLDRAAKKLHTNNLNVDMVVLNGGMARFYFVQDRLEQFFGFPMILVDDPDTAVAQGAAVYHYYRAHQEAERPLLKSQFQTETVEETHVLRNMGSVLSESLYLGVAGGANILLAEAGVDLPYECLNLPEFALPAGCKDIEIPLREKHGNHYITVGRGKITFPYTCNRPQPIQIFLRINRSSLLILDAKSPAGICSTEILFGENTNNLQARNSKKFLPPKGTNLIPENELSSLVDLVVRLDNSCKNQRYVSSPKKIRKIKNDRYELIGRLHEKQNVLKNCGNPQDFAAPMLSYLNGSIRDALALNLLPVARALCPFWSEEQRRQLSSICIRWIGGALAGCTCAEFRLMAECEAIQTIGACGIAEEFQKLDVLKGKERYATALNQAQQLFAQHVDTQ